MSAPATHRAIEAIWKIESPRLMAGLSRMLRDLGRAEELAQDALLAALEHWPTSGVPDNPGAWLMATAKRRALDELRRVKRTQRKHEELAYELDEEQKLAPDLESGLDDDVGDDLLRLVFIACHPVLSTEARVALTLRLLGGLSTQEIARAFLSSETTVAQRIVRAKRALAEARVPFEVPRRAELPERLSSVLEVLYLIFNEGYSATTGDDWMRPQLCEDALRLTRVLCELTPDESEVFALLALMEVQSSRSAARLSPAGEPILLLEQDRSRWDELAISRGLSALARAGSLAHERGRYLLEASLAACHARARTPEQTDWTAIAHLYAELAAKYPSPVVELNRAVALGMAFGPQAALGLVEELCRDPLLKDYHWLPSVRGDLLEKLGNLREACLEFERAARLTRNARERALLLERAEKCRSAARG